MYGGRQGSEQFAKGPALRVTCLARLSGQVAHLNVKCKRRSLNFFKAGLIGTFTVRAVTNDGFEAHLCHCL